MKIFFLDCGGKKNFTANLILNIMKHNYDLIFLADAKDIIADVEKKLPEYKFLNSNYNLGINILAKSSFKATDIKHKTNHPLIDQKYTMDKYLERLFLVEYEGLKILAVKAPKHKPYKQIYMVKVLELAKTVSPDIIIGNFNTGYLEDALDATDFTFTTGFLTFQSLENLGYSDPNKGMGEYSYEIERGDRERIDHAFVKIPIIEARYSDMIHYGFDHKGLRVKL